MRRILMVALHDDNFLSSHHDTKEREYITLDQNFVKKNSRNLDIDSL